MIERVQVCNRHNRDLTDCCGNRQLTKTSILCHHLFEQHLESSTSKTPKTLKAKLATLLIRMYEIYENFQYDT